MRYLFVLNPSAGKGNFIETLKKEIEILFASRPEQYEVYVTNAPFDGTLRVREFCERYPQCRVIACGGDGTLNEVLQGAYGFPGAEIGVYPCGSGNDFVKSFDDKAWFLNLHNVIDGQSKLTDCIKANDRIALNIVCAGFDADVAYNMMKFKDMPLVTGSFSYILSLIYCLFFRKFGYEFSVEIDGKRLRGKYLLTAVSNGTTYGGVFIAAPEAKLNDGLLDVTMVNKISRRKFIGMVGDYKKGSHIENGKVIERFSQIMSLYKVKSIKIRSGRPFAINSDGEGALTSEVDISVLPNAVRLICPENSGNFCETP